MAGALALATMRDVRMTYVHQDSLYVLAIRLAGEPSGYVRLVQHHRHSWIDEIAVHPAHRGKGLASLLLETVIARFGHRHLGLYCCPFVPYTRPEKPGLDRDVLLAWYERYGFVPDDDGDCMWRPAH